MLKLSPLALFSFGAACASFIVVILRLNDAISTRLTASNYIVCVDRLYTGQIIAFSIIFFVSFFILQVAIKVKKPPVKKEKTKGELQS